MVCGERECWQEALLQPAGDGLHSPCPRVLSPAESGPEKARSEAAAETDGPAQLQKCRGYKQRKAYQTGLLASTPGLE